MIHYMSSETLDDIIFTPNLLLRPKTETTVYPRRYCRSQSKAEINQLHWVQTDATSSMSCALTVSFVSRHQNCYRPMGAYCIGRTRRPHCLLHLLMSSVIKNLRFNSLDISPRDYLPPEKIWKLVVTHTPDPNRPTRLGIFGNWH